MSLWSLWTFVVLLPSLPQPTSPSCVQGKPRQCLDAEFAPGANLGGEGFDITTMERKGAFVLDMNLWQRKGKTCVLCSNPYMGNRRQKLPLSVVDWRAKQACSSKVSSAVHRSSEALVASSVSSVENNWKVNLDFSSVKRGGSLMLAGSNSKLAAYSMEKTKNDKFSFSSLGASCEFYSYRVSSASKLNPEFLRAVNQLPKVYNPESKQQFYRLIDDFGTHYITKVKLGGSVRSVTSIRQCEASLQGLDVEEVQSCLGVEASVTLGATVSTEVKHCKRDAQKTENRASFSSVFTDRFTEIKGGRTTEPDLLFSANKNRSAYKEWLTTLPDHPDVLSYSLDSLHELLPRGSPAQLNLRSAISHYVLEKGLWRNCSEPCAAGVRSDSSDPCVCRCHHNNAVNRDCCPTRRGMARVTITVMRASGLWGDYFTSTDGYVKVLYDKVSHSSPIVYNNNNPHWMWVLPLDNHDLSSANAVKIQVWDRDNKWDDDLLGECGQVLTPGAREEVCYLNHGKLFYRWEVKCAPGLGGISCTDYVPSPMTQSLRELYVSRHARPIPKAVLSEMGVFLGEAGPTKSDQEARSERRESAG